MARLKPTLSFVWSDDVLARPVVVTSSAARTTMSSSAILASQPNWPLPFSSPSTNAKIDSS